MNASTIAPEAAPLVPRPARMVGAWRCALLALALALACLGLPAAAATINVAAGAVAVANDGVCSLREAIHNANANAQVDNTDCVAGNGDDTLQLAAGSTYTLLDADPASTQDGLPAITSTLVFEGAGATIERSSGLTCFLDGAQQVGEFRLLSIPVDGDATLNNLTLRNGCADGASNQGVGGAIRSASRLTVNQVIFDGNRAEFGGAVALVLPTQSNVVQINASTFSNNSAAASGGALSVGAGRPLTLTGTTIAGNTAGGQAGGIMNSGTLTLVNSTVIGNTARDVGGGGISNGAVGTLRLDAVTISANKTTVATGGGGVRSQGALTVKNSIIAGNFEGGDCVRVSGTVTALGKNLDSDGSCTALDSVRFSRVTATQLALAPASFSAGDRALAPLFGSVAVDAVTDCTRIDGTTANAVDQLGNNRPQDGDTTPGAACDIGAIERAPVGGVLNVSGACTLGDAIDAANSDTTVGGCVDSGAGPDVLVLGANATLAAADTVRSSELRGAYAGLPDVTSEIVIAAGAGNVIERAPAATCANADQPDEFRLLNVTGGGTLTLVGLTLRNGCADIGGGALVVGGKLAVLGGTWSGNTARSATSDSVRAPRGGAVALEGSSGTGSFQGVQFLGNRAVNSVNIAQGGAIAAGGVNLPSGAIEIADCTFEGNTAGPGQNAWGGAVRTADNAQRVTISGSMFSSNQATGSTSGHGGAFYGALSELSKSRWVDNQAIGPSSDGGAVVIISGAGEHWLSGLVFERNAAGGSGGALYSPARLRLLRSRFVGNVVQGAQGRSVQGGAVYAGDGPSFLSDLSFEGNLAQGGVGASGNGGHANGGGLMLDSGVAFLANVTFNGNRAVGGASTSGIGGSARGGGLDAYTDISQEARGLTFADNQAIAGTGGGGNGLALGGGVLAENPFLLGSSVLEGNTATVAGTSTSSDCAETQTGYVTSLGYNSVASTSACSFAATGDQVGVVASLLASGDHGCTAQLPGGSCLPTMPVRIGAPALDRGSCFSAAISRDARQFSRPVDIPGVPNSTDGCDAGAYESRDGDADGVEDWVDNCPFVANPTQLDRDLNLGAPPVAIWRLDEGQGTTAGDGIGTHAGTLAGNPQWVSGIAGAALAFDGAGDGVLIPHDAAFNPPVGGDFSVTAWVKLPASQVQTLRTTNLVVGKDQEGGAGFPFPWVLRVFNQAAPVGAVGHLQGARSDGSLVPQVISTSRIDDGRWHHAAYIKRGSTLEMWVDGVLEASATDTTTVATGNTRQVGIGLREADSAKLDLRGNVDEVLYAAYALTLAQVQDLYQRRGLSGDGIGAACDCDDADPTNTSAACANMFANGFE